MLQLFFDPFRVTWPSDKCSCVWYSRAKGHTWTGGDSSCWLLKRRSKPSETISRTLCSVRAGCYKQTCLANVGQVLKERLQSKHLWRRGLCVPSISSPQPDVWPPGAELRSAGRGPDPSVYDPQGRGDLHTAHCGTGQQTKTGLDLIFLHIWVCPGFTKQLFYGIEI